MVVELRVTDFDCSQKYRGEPILATWHKALLGERKGSPPLYVETYLPPARDCGQSRLEKF